MSRMYETMFIVQPDLSDEDLKALTGRVQNIIETMKGELKRLDDWGVRKLAYPIEKCTKGRYYYLRYDGDPTLIAELERRLRLNDKVIRYQSVKLEKEPITPAAAASRPAIAEIAEEAAPETAPADSNEVSEIE